MVCKICFYSEFLGIPVKSWRKSLVAIVTVGDKMFLICHVTSRDHVFNGLRFLIVSHHFAKFCGHRICGSSDTAAKIVCINLQDHLIKGSGGFILIDTYILLMNI